MSKLSREARRGVPRVQPPKESGPPKELGPPKVGARSGPVAVSAEMRKMQMSLKALLKAKKHADLLEKRFERGELAELGLYRDRGSGLLKKRSTHRAARTLTERRAEKRLQIIPKDLKCTCCARVVSDKRRWVVYDRRVMKSLKEILAEQEPVVLVFKTIARRVKGTSIERAEFHDDRVLTEDSAVALRARRLENKRRAKYLSVMCTSCWRNRALAADPELLQQAMTRAEKRRQRRIAARTKKDAS